MHPTNQKNVRSVLEAEIYALAECFDFACTIKDELQRVLNKKIPLAILTDSKGLFNVIFRASRITERRLKSDFEATREAYNRTKIDEIGWISRTGNIADAFTKHTTNAAMDALMENGMILQELRQ